MEPACDTAALLDAHIAAWNRHDVPAFVATMTPDAEVYRHPGELQLKGREAIGAHFLQLWAKQPKLSVKVVRRTKLETHVVDEESLSLDGQEIARDVAIYAVEGCLIRRVDTVE